MQITLEAFTKSINELIQVSEEIHDGWNLHQSTDDHTSYITKKTRLGGEELITIEYHVAYNMSYSTPVLCLNCWRSDGSLLTMEQCWKVMEFDGEDMYSTLTQLDHPVLMRPFLTLHPCRTAELLECVFPGTKNAVVSWLSAIGPAVKLHLDLAYAKLTV